MVNYNEYILSPLDVRYIGYFYCVFPLHSNTFHELFYNHSLPGIEKVMFEIHFFNTNLTPVINNQIESLRQFQSIISEFQNDIDCYIEELNKNIEYLLKFNSFVTKCVKSYLCKYITCISNQYNSCHKSIKENLKTFKCIQKCVQSMLSQLNSSSSGNGVGRRNGRTISGSEGKVKRVFSSVSDSTVSNAFSYINNNYPSQKIKSINIYLTSIVKFLDESNPINTTTTQLGSLKHDLSQFSGHITNYTNRIKWYLIPPLSQLISKEREIKTFNDSNGNGIKDKYDKIKHKVSYCKSSLEFEVQRLELISQNARMLQKQLEMVIDTIKKHQSNVKKLEEFKSTIDKLKRNKDRSMNYITRTSQMVICNLYDISRISNCLNSGKNKMSITTIKQDIDNINSSIKDINNILSVIRSQLTLLRPVNFGFDLSPICEVESCVQNIVCDIHKKYCCLSSIITQINTPVQGSVPTLGGGCELSGKLECGCSTQTGAQDCATCQDCQSEQGCPSCECLKQLLKTPCSDSNIKQNLDSINKIICKLIDGKKVDGCEETQHQHCSHSCQTCQQAQATTSCETRPGEQTNTCLTTISQLIKSTLEEIKQCQTTSKLTCEDKEEVKCENTPPNSCQTLSDNGATTTCSQGSKEVKCNELDKVKLCVDNMVNKCNCQKLNEFLSDKNIKSCIGVFKWIFIYNFRELLSFYLCFDKSILNEIFCIMMKLQQMKFDLGGMISINNRIKCRIDCIKSGINELTKKVDSLLNIMKSGIKSSVVDMECAIEGVPRNLIRCSLQSCIESIRVNVINPISHNIDSIYNNIKY